MKKKLLTTLLLAVLLVFTLAPQALALPIVINDAWIAANGGSAIYDMSTGGHVSGDVITIDASVPVTLTGTAPDGVSVVCTTGSDLVLSSAYLDCQSTPGVCALSFAGAGNTLTCQGINDVYSGLGQPGILAAAGTELTVLGDGELYVYVGEPDTSSSPYLSGAAIGGGAGQAGGTITVNMDASGYIQASADYDFDSEGAGIGGGSKAAGGTIILTSGVIDAFAIHGAGIGGGGDFELGIWGGAAGNITINGADVWANSLTGAGIGSGAICWDNSAGSVTITSGYAYGTSQAAAGIGGGMLSSAGTLNFSSGEIIGEGTIGIGSNSGGSLTINGNALVFAIGDGTEPDIGSSLTAFVIQGDAEVFTSEGIFDVAPTTSHAVEPGNEVSGSDLSGVSAAYGFADPNWPSSWETQATYGWFTDRVAINPQTGDSSNNYLALCISIILLLTIVSLIFIKKRVIA